MGSRQAANLRRAGHDLTVFNRTREKAEQWAAEHGGQVADSPREVAERSDVVITMLVDGAQVEDALFGEGPEGEAPVCGGGRPVGGARGGALCPDMPPPAPPAARRIGAALKERG